MSKGMIEAFVKAQYKALGADNNKDRLRFMVAGIKDGKLYSHGGGFEFGEFDVEAPDTEFIPESDLEIARITGAKIAKLTLAMQKFFETYSNGGEEVEDEVDNDDNGDDTNCDVDCDSKSNCDNVEPESVEPAIDFDAVEKACKKAIKKGDLKKATKLLEKLVDQDCHKKLSKKLKKASN